MGNGCTATGSGLTASAPTHVHRARRANDASSRNIDRALGPYVVGMADMESSVLIETIFVRANLRRRL
jgi:hypothetical protein